MNNVYISLTGNDTNDGIENNPVRSLSKAIDLCNQNGNIYLDDGDYYINSSTEYKCIIDSSSLYMLQIDKSVNIFAINPGKVSFIGNNNNYGLINIPISHINVSFNGIDFSKDDCIYYTLCMYTKSNDQSMSMTLNNCKFSGTFYNYSGIFYFNNCYLVDSYTRRGNFVYLNNCILLDDNYNGFGDISILNENITNSILNTTFEESQNIHDKGVFSGQYDWRNLIRINSINYNIIN